MHWKGPTARGLTRRRPSTAELGTVSAASTQELQSRGDERGGRKTQEKIMAGHYAYLMKTTKPHNRSKNSTKCKDKKHDKNAAGPSIITTQKCDHEEILAAAGGTVH